MKVFSKIIVAAMLFVFLFSATSCMVLSPKRQHDNGKHKGWYKNKHKNKKHKRSERVAQFNDQKTNQLFAVSND